MKKYYKIVEKKDGDYYYLFHGIDSSRKIVYNKWITANRKIVFDVPNSSKYESGFHILLTEADAIKYLQRFRIKDNKTVIEIEAMGLRKKQHSRSNVYLANKIRVKK